MNIKKIEHKNRLYIIGTIKIILLFWVIVPGEFAAAQDTQVRNVQAYQQGKNVIVEYDLEGHRQATFEVDLRLSRDGGRTFDYAPTALSGAVGSGVSPGQGKEIVWPVLQDFSEGLTGQGYQFKVLARREGTVPNQTPTPTVKRTTEPQSDIEPDVDTGFSTRLGVGLAYNTRESVQFQYYDGYQFSFWLEAASSLGLKMSYRNATGTFRQISTLDFDLLYNAGFLYGGTGIGVFNFNENLFEYKSNSYNLNAVIGAGFTIGSIYPYVEYRFPFARERRDEVLSGGFLYSF